MGSSSSSISGVDLDVAIGDVISSTGLTKLYTSNKQPTVIQTTKRYTQSQPALTDTKCEFSIQLTQPQQPPLQQQQQQQQRQQISVPRSPPPPHSFVVDFSNGAPVISKTMVKQLCSGYPNTTSLIRVLTPKFGTVISFGPILPEYYPAEVCHVIGIPDVPESMTLVQSITQLTTLPIKYSSFRIIRESDIASSQQFAIVGVYNHRGLLHVSILYNKTPNNKYEHHQILVPWAEFISRGISSGTPEMDIILGDALYAFRKDRPKYFA